MSAKMKIQTGMVMAVLLLFAYGVSQVTKDKAEERPATVTVSWEPERAGVVIIVRVGGVNYVGGATYVKSPFTETYDVKPGDAILVAVDPVVLGPKITCQILVRGMAPKTVGPLPGHTVCQTVVA